MTVLDPVDPAPGRPRRRRPTLVWPAAEGSGDGAPAAEAPAVATPPAALVWPSATVPGAAPSVETPSVTDLADPDAPAAGVSPEAPAARAPRVRWTAAAVALAVLAGALAWAYVSHRTAPPPPPPEPAAAEATAAPPLALDTWIRIVGDGEAAPDHAAGPAAPVDPETVGWGVRARDREDAPVPRAPAFYGRAPLLSFIGPDGWIEPPPAAGLLRTTVPLPQTAAGRAAAPSVAVTLPPALDGFAHAAGLGAWVMGVNYADPIGVGLPLLRVGGYERFQISKSFTVADFATRDGAPFARISPDLVAGLEAMRALVGPLTVISGYRHPEYNALPTVRGARYSRHTAGQAADVWSPTLSSVEVARAAVQAMGCAVGLGLGRNTVHVDVRGYLSTWTYPGAPLSSAQFDGWVRQLCGDAAVPPPRGAGRTPEVWLAAVGEADEAEAIHTVDDVEPDEAPPPAALPLDARIQRELGPFAEASRRREGPGVVVLDLRDGEDDDFAAHAHYARIRSPEARRLGVAPLARWLDRQGTDDLFIYAIRFADGRVATGISPVAPTAGPAAPAPTAAPEPPGRWFVVVAGAETLDEAERLLTAYDPALRAVGLGLAVRAAPGGRYRLLSGPFEAEADARRAIGQTRGVIDADAEVVRVRL